jgi:hypothetical protein
VQLRRLHDGRGPRRPRLFPSRYRVYATLSSLGQP